jgi:hypothetical protein
VTGQESIAILKALSGINGMYGKGKL